MEHMDRCSSMNTFLLDLSYLYCFYTWRLHMFALVYETNKTMDDMWCKMARHTWTRVDTCERDCCFFLASELVWETHDIQCMVVLDGFGLHMLLCMQMTMLTHIKIWSLRSMSLEVFLCFEGKLRFVMESELFYDDYHSRLDAHL